MITICCWPAHGEAPNEEPDGESGARQRAAVLQSRADADGGSQLRFLGGTSREGEPQPHPLPGSAAGDRVRRAGPARHQQPNSRCAIGLDGWFWFGLVWLVLVGWFWLVLVGWFWLVGRF